VKSTLHLRRILPELGRGRSKAAITEASMQAFREKGRELPLQKVTTEQIDRLRRSLLGRGLAPRTVAERRRDAPPSGAAAGAGVSLCSSPYARRGPRRPPADRRALDREAARRGGQRIQG
jgi:hypothetical protein